ncbi:MAG: ABC transporter ATP-binding protein, partial [Candidatus Saccharimonadales bacterium]
MSGPKPTSQPPRLTRPMGGGGIQAGTGEKAEHFGDTLRTFAKYIRRYWLTIGVVAILAIASTIFAIVGPKILGNMTNYVVEGYVQHRRLASAGINFAKIEQLAWLLVGLYLLSSLFSLIQGWIMAGLVQKISYQFRQDISAKINHLPLSYFDSRPYGEVLTHITNDVDTVSQSLNQAMTQVISSLTLIVGIILVMLTISWQLTLVALVTLPLSLVGVGVIIKKSQKYFRDQQAILGHLNAQVEETFGAQLVVKAYNGEERANRQFQKLNKQLYGTAWRAQFVSRLTIPMTKFFSNLAYAGVAVVGAGLAVRGTINIGDIQAFLQYVNSLSQPVSQVANAANVMQQMVAAAERVFKFLGQPQEATEPDNMVSLPAVRGQVEFDNVVFGYLPDQTIIKGFSAKVSPGQRIAIVGPTGAGKTTMVNLLMRFYEINSGSIKVDGVNIKDMHRADVRKMFGMVLQDTWLFNGTIRDNIAYAASQPDDKAIVAAAQRAHVDHFIGALPHGYDTELNEEADNVSQGEKQLLTIARATLADPPMLIL